MQAFHEDMEAMVGGRHLAPVQTRARLCLHNTHTSLSYFTLHSTRTSRTFCFTAATEMEITNVERRPPSDYPLLHFSKNKRGGSNTRTTARFCVRLPRQLQFRHYFG